MKKKLGVFTAVALVIAAGGTAGAGMWWQRGDPGTTFQDWNFLDGDNPATPEYYYNPNAGTPTAAVVVSGISNSHQPGWSWDYLGRYGVWHGRFASVTMNIPNFDAANSFKEVWVEVGFLGDLLPDPGSPQYPAGTYGPQLTAWLNGVELQGVVMLGAPVIEAADEGWQKLKIGWRIEPNPDVEEIYLAFSNSGAAIDYIFVDTICVPEPATLMLLGIGGLLLTYRKR